MLPFSFFELVCTKQKFEWSGALSVITTLAGGGFLSYWSQPRNFTAYGIGFFIGFATYWRLLQRQGDGDGIYISPSADAPVTGSSDGSEYSAASELNQDDPSVGDLFDITVPAEHRVQALLAFKTGRRSEDISVTASLRDDLYLSGFDIIVLAALLRGALLPPQSGPLKLTVVEDLISLVEEKPTKRSD